jgi:Uma2 family endonuclease
MATDQQLMTAYELSCLPRGRARHELVRGELRTMPLATFPEAVPATEIMSSLWRFIDDYRAEKVVTRVGFQLETDPDTVRAPDVAYISGERLRAAGDVTGYFPGAPDLAVEVISPTDRYGDVADTVDDWLVHGTRLVFVVNPRWQTITVHRPGRPIRALTVDDTLDGEDVVPGWTLAVRDLFDES